MFISKKKFEERLHKEKMEVAAEWEKKMLDSDKWHWEQRDKDRELERFNKLAERVLECEKKLGLAKETPHCPYAVTPNY